MKEGEGKIERGKGWTSGVLLTAFRLRIAVVVCRLIGDGSFKEATVVYCGGILEKDVFLNRCF